MTTYTKFALAGVGGIGQTILDALVNQPGVSVVVLTRAGSNKTFPSGVTAKDVDYTSQESLVEALHGVQVVISTLSGPGFAAQPALVDAAKAAGVSLFVPSEFGLDTTGATGRMADKAALQEQLKRVGLPYTLFFSGFFADMILSPFIGFDFATGTIRIVGTGTVPATFTSRRDIGVFVARALTELSPEKLAWATLRVQGDRRSLLEAASLWEKVKGRKATIEHRNIDEVRKTVAEKLGLETFGDYLSVSVEEGALNIGEPDNALLPGFKPETLEQVIQDYY